MKHTNLLCKMDQCAAFTLVLLRSELLRFRQSRNTAYPLEQASILRISHHASIRDLIAFQIALPLDKKLGHS